MTYEDCPESISHVIWKIETFLEEDKIYIYTRNIMRRTNTQSPSKLAPWDLTQFSHLPSTDLSYFPESHLWFETSSLSKVTWVLGKARSHKLPNLGSKGIKSAGWFDVLPKTSAMRLDVWAGVLSWWSCQSAVAHSCGLLNLPNSFHAGMFKLNTKFDADSLLCSVSHFERDGHTVHMVTQWCLHPPLTSAVKLSLFMHMHSGPLSVAATVQECSHCINNVWTFSGQNSHIPYEFSYCWYIVTWIKTHL